MSEILPCPFCGEQPNVSGPSGYVQEHMIYCACEAAPSISHRAEESALRIWNTRAPPHCDCGRMLSTGLCQVCDNDA